MMTDNIIKMPEPLDKLGQRIDAAYARAQRGQQEWIEGTLELAQALADGRGRFPSDNAFGAWCSGNGHGHVNDHDRAALINMAGNLLLARIILEETERRSWQLIWLNEMKVRFASAPKPPTLPYEPAENGSNADYKPPEPVSAAPQVAENPTSQPKQSPSYGLRDGYTGKPAKEGAAARLDMVKELKLSPDEAAEFLGAYPQMRQKILKRDFTTAGRNKRIKRDGISRLFQRGLQVVRAGKAPKLSNSDGNGHVDLRTFFPDLPEAFCRPMKFEAIIAQFDRLLTVNNEAARLLPTRPLTEVFDELNHLFETGKPMPPRKPTAVTIPETDSKAHIKHDVRYCGEIIWPQEWLKEASYKDLNAGWHLVDFWVHHLENATPQKPKEVAVKVRGLIRDLEAADSIHGIVRVMDAVMSAYSRKNEGHNKADFAGCIAPGSPR